MLKFAGSRVGFGVGVSFGGAGEYDSAFGVCVAEFGTELEGFVVVVGEASIDSMVGRPLLRG